jgi:histidyl-tRNA synthetase
LSIGLSRLLSWLLTQEPYASLPLSPAKVMVACQDPAYADHYAKVAAMLRKEGIATEMALGGALGTQFKNADKKGIRYAVIIGQSEVDAGTAMVKDLQTGTQNAVGLTALAEALRG